MNTGKLYVAVGLFMLAAPVCAQPDSASGSRLVGYHLEMGGIAATAAQTPFWLRSRQYGTVPLRAPAGQVRIGAAGWLTKLRKPGDRSWQVSYGVEVVGNLAQKSQLLLPEAYVQVQGRRWSLYAGRQKEVFGLMDTVLTSGSYAWSGNALPIPKIQLSTRGFVPLKFTRNFVAIHALYAHGWFPNTDSLRGSFLHQKAAFIRLGKPKSTVKFYAGVTHFAQWGGSSEFMSAAHAVQGRLPSSFRDYLYVVSVRQPDGKNGTYSRHDSLNYFGNHLGSIDLALTFELGQSAWMAYVQHPFEDKSGVYLKNIPDGLYGLRWQNRSQKPLRTFRLQQITAEFLTTLDQSGSTIQLPNSKFEGADEYFNNYQYLDGWTTKERVIGTPFFTRWMDARPEWHELRGAFTKMMISNNRVQVAHVGLRGQWPSGVEVRALLSQSWNRGRPMRPAPQTVIPQFSGLAECSFPVQWLGGLSLSAALAVDQGEWLPTSVGGSFRLRKVWR